MKCEEFVDLSDAWLDGEATPEQVLQIDAHLEQCRTCRQSADALREQNRDLQQVFAGDRQVADRVAQRVVSEVTGHAEPSPAAPRTIPSWVWALAGLAVAFLVATFVYRPWIKPHVPEVVSEELPLSPDKQSQSPADDAAQQSVERPAAEIVASIGVVRVRPAGTSNWSVADKLGMLSCPTSSVVETETNSQCEMITQDGCTLRLNAQTKLVVRSRDEVELQRGQLWCSAPDHAQFKVIAQAAPDEAATSKAAWSTMICRPNTNLLTIKRSDRIQVTSARGEIDVQTAGGQQTLKRGESADVVSGKIIPVSHYQDPLVATRWIHPLLQLKGPGDRELGLRVDAMLARIGYAKLSGLYESEIRSLGEHCVLPLIRFLQSSMSNKNVSRRLVAARIVSDMAPTWAIGDLIRLLDSPDENVRVLMATALKRLTGTDQGRAAAKWREKAPENDLAREKWRAWWEENRTHFPNLDATATRRIL